MKKQLLFLLFLFLANLGFAQTPTFSSDVASIIYSNCTSCHRQNSIAPFLLQSYQDVYNNRFSIVNAIQNKIMPPWSPDPSYNTFHDERKLTDAQVKLISDWVSSGAAEGNTATEPPAPVFSDASQPINADFSKRIHPHTVHNTLDEFAFFTIPSGLMDNALIKQIELVPANRKIVHHIFVFIDSTGEFSKFVQNDSFTFKGNNYISGGIMNSIRLIGGWLPGGTYYTVPDQTAFRVPKHSNYIIQIHYAPGSAGKSDSTQLNIKYTTESGLKLMNMRPLLDNTVNMDNGPIFIPANSTRTFKESMFLNIGATLLSVTPHMHLLGKRLKVFAIEPTTGDTVKIIDDRWNFHWQGMYTFDQPIHLKPGMVLHAEGSYDNTSSNTDNPNFPPKDMSAGTSTLTEMMQVFFCYVPDVPGEDFRELRAVNLIKTGEFDCNLYPNPVKSGNVLQLSSLPKDDYIITLHSIDGKLIQSYQSKVNTGNLELKLPQVPGGLYFLKLSGRENSTAMKIRVE